METKHTQGTWHSHDGQIYPDQTGKTICLIPYYDKHNEEAQANAKLIAASPQLLEALQTVESVLFEWNKDGKYTNLINHARNAINQATN